MAVSKRKRSKSLTSKVNALSKRMRTIAKNTKDIRFNPISQPAFTCSMTAPYVVEITGGMGPGPDRDGQFQGDEITAHRVDITLSLQGSNPVSGLGLYGADIVRMIVWVEKELDSAAPAVPLNVLDSNYIGTAGIVSAPYNRQRTGQFKILKDKIIMLSQGDNVNGPDGVSTIMSSGIPNQRFLRYRIKVPKRWSTLRWNPSGGHFNNNRIFLMFVSNSNFTGTAPGSASLAGNWTTNLIYSA